MTAVLLIVAIICFALAAFTVTVAGVALGWLGLLFLAAALLLPYAGGWAPRP